jgi:hypothetical protein
MLLSPTLDHIRRGPWNPSGSARWVGLALLLALATASQAGAPLGTAIAERADALVGLRSVSVVSRSVPDDCTGLVRLIYGEKGIDLRALPAKPGDNGVTILFRAARRARAFHRREPKAGDIVFFRETYDRNRDGKRNDGLTHVGVVDSVGQSGTLTFVHRARAGIRRSRLDLRHPRNKRTNDILRRASAGNRALLAGELVTGFASPERLRKN